ncbi:MAG: hypothetical protein PHC51_11115 [bacterium]|nr:hypothetical protein [bacterium]
MSQSAAHDIYSELDAETDFLPELVGDNPYNLPAKIYPKEVRQITDAEVVTPKGEQDSTESDGSSIVICPSWRSIPGHMIAFTALCYMAVKLSAAFPMFVLQQKFPVGGYTLILSLPVFILPAAVILAHGFFRIYDQYAVMDNEHLTLHTGVLSFNHEVSVMETASMLVVLIKRSPIDALFGVGTVCVGRFSRKAMEMELPGVSNPYPTVRKIKSLIRAARNVAADKAARKSAMSK